MTVELDDGRIRSPRAVFAERFGELHAAAGNPTLRRVATAADNRMRAARGNRPGGASAQRISDWKAGRNVPARFESLLPVVLTLVEMAAKAGNPLPHPVADPAEWQRLWREATSWNPEHDTEAACPYQGLRAYSAAQRNLFFGRTRAVTELAAMVRSATGVTAVIGASGAGKSSLLAAGLAPALGDWEITTLTPGAHPYVALREALGQASETQSTAAENPPPESEDPPNQAEEQPEAGAVLAALAARSGGARRLVIVDQLEELFTACTDERERELFLSVLDGCANRSDDPVAVVVALRADFYAHCLNHLILQDALEHRGYLLGPLRMDELSQAVSGPARAAGLELEPGLEELITSELCGAGDHHGRRTYDPGALPMLSHVMAATWQHREGRRLTIAGYRRAGGVVGSVAETAEYAWNELTSDQQRAARELLLGLVTVSQDSRDTRRTVARDELLRRTDAHEDATAALELLARTRLITLDADAVTLTHEIVLTAWPRLRGWIDEDRVGYLIRQRLESDAAEWAAQERDPSLLYSGTRLQSARDHADPPPVGPLAQEFLTSSASAVGTTRRRARRLRVILALFGVGLLVLGVGLYSQTRLAEQRSADRDFAAVLAAADQVQPTDPSLAAQLNLVAWRLRPGDPAVRSRLLESQTSPLLTVTPAHTESISKIAYQPAARLLASIDDTGNLRLWDTADPKHPRALGQQLTGLGAVALAATGRMMATGSSPAWPLDTPDPTNPVVTLWDTSNPATPKQLATVPTDANQTELAFAPDGRTLVTLTSHRLTLWDIGNPAAPVQLASRELRPADDNGATGTLRFSPDGRLLALIVQDGNTETDSVRLWDLTHPNTPMPLDSAIAVSSHATLQSGISAIAFRPGSNILAVGITPESGSHAIVQLWEISDPQHPRLISSREVEHGSISALDFSPDGRQLATAAGKTVTVWNVTDPTDPTHLVDGLATGAGTCHSPVGGGPSATNAFQCYPSPRAVAFTSDGRSLITGVSTGDLHTWSLPTALTPIKPGSNDMSVLTGDSVKLAIMSDVRRATTIWDIGGTQAPKMIAEYRTDENFASVTLSPDGTMLLELKAADTGSMTIVDVSDPAAVHIRGTWTFPDPGAIRRWAISADFRTLATVDKDDMLQLWDFTDPPHATQLGAPIRIPAAAGFDFGPDSKSLIETETTGDSGHQERVTTLWSLADRSHPRRVADLLRHPADALEAVTLSPDLRTMAVSSGKGSIQLWDISDPARPRRLGTPIVTTVPAIQQTTFTPDSRTLLTSGFDGALGLWDLSDRSHPTEFATLTPNGGYSDGGGLSVGDQRLAAVNTEGIFALWDLDPQHAVDRICSATGSYWTQDLWTRYLPQFPYQPPCQAN
ncbi:nSTAND1 domain-containing NTPase [Nocardia heshunensis]